MRLPKLDRILSAESELQPLLAKARDIRALAGLVDGLLPPGLARQTRVANFREGELVLVAANSSTAAKLRLLAPSLSRSLIEQRWQVNSVSVRVQPNLSRNVAPQKSAHLSTVALETLRDLYEDMADSPARAALGALLARRGAIVRGALPPQTAAAARPPRKRRT